MVEQEALPMTTGDTPCSDKLSKKAAARLMKRATYASVTVATILIGVKLWAWLISDSISILSSLIDSLLDLAASAVNLLAVHHAVQPADREHRFGHGKAESLAGLGQAMFIAGSVVFLSLQAIERLFHPHPVQSADVGIGVIIFSLFLTGGLVVYQRYVVQRTGSLAISADFLHYQSDFLLNISVLAGLFLSAYMGWLIADPLFALVVAVIIGHSAWQIVRGAINVLMDSELPDEDRARIQEIAMSHVGVETVHDLRTRSSGLNVFIQLHLEMDGDILLRQAHRIGDEVMAEIEAAFPQAEVLVHQDPAGEEDEPAFKS